MRLFVTSDLHLAGGAVGLGVDELRWPAPVRPGDVLQIEIEVIEVRPSRSKSNRGIVRIRTTTRNQRDGIVQTMIANVLVPCRK
jgi:acyl dehydratase